MLESLVAFAEASLPWLPPWNVTQFNRGRSCLDLGQYSLDWLGSCWFLKLLRCSNCACMGPLVEFLDIGSPWSTEGCMGMSLFLLYGSGERRLLLQFRSVWAGSWWFGKLFVSSTRSYAWITPVPSRSKLVFFVVVAQWAARAPFPCFPPRLASYWG